MPRTVDPSLSQNAYLTLFNIEQLGKFLEDKKEQAPLKGLLKQIAEMVDRHIEIFQQRGKRGILCNSSNC